MSVPMASNNHKGASHSSCLDLKNAVMAFFMLLAPCDVNTSANVAPHFDYLDRTNAVVSESVSSDANGIT